MTMKNAGLSPKLKKFSLDHDELPNFSPSIQPEFCFKDTQIQISSFQRIAQYKVKRV